jgi:hypothetical protein
VSSDAASYGFPNRAAAAARNTAAGAAKAISLIARAFIERSFLVLDLDHGGNPGKEVTI